MSWSEPESVRLMYERCPLIRFSIYTQAQADALLDLAAELTQLLDVSFLGDQTVDGRNWHRIHGRFWLWVLGAYEVVRTMLQHKTCFSERLCRDTAEFKKSVSALRVPFAKQEIQGKKLPVSFECSVSKTDMLRKDFGYSVGGQTIYMRDLFANFQKLMRSIKREDVLHDLRDMFDAPRENPSPAA